jgi:formylglycine-generating enzyme required for sulfatase activity
VTDEPATQIGGVNLSDISGGETRTGDISADVTAGGHIAGRDVVIYNYHYYAQAEVSPAPAAETAVAAEPIPANPYRGLFTFRPEHAPFFFGRESFTQSLVAAVESRRLVTVLGASGSGKSSVVFAGLVPALVNRPGEPWLFTTFRPEADPFFGLASALIPLLEPDLGKTRQIGEARDLAARLRAGQSPLADYIRAIHQAQPDHRLLLIADQFEELYTLCRDPDARRAFLDLLLPAVLPSPPTPRLPISPTPLHVVITLRADFLGQASLYRPLADALQGTTELLGPMTEAELRAAIEKPAAAQGVAFEAKLVDDLLADVGRQEGSLPLLEFALSELWQRQERRRLTHKAYAEIGKVEGALSRHADRAYASLSAVEQEQARRVLVQLVNPGAGTEDTRRLATRQELGQNWELVARLATERLVVTSAKENQQDTVEVVHEALIRNWPQLRQWMESDRAFLTWRLGLRADLARWQEAGHDAGALLRGAPLAVAQEKFVERPGDLTQREQDYIVASLAEQRRQERNQRLTLVGVSIAAVVMAILAGLSIWLFLTVADQNEKAQAELNFYQTIDPAERLKELHNLFSRQDADSQARARQLFFALPAVDQVALLRVEDKQVVAVGRALLPNLADINRIGHTDQHLSALLETLDSIDADDEMKRNLEQWLDVRAAVREDEFETALAEYKVLIKWSNDNPALWYEQARAQAALGHNQDALASLNKVMELAQSPAFAASGVMPVGPEFATTEQMAKAVGRLLLLHPELADLFEDTAANYPALAKVKLTRPTVITDSQGVPMVKVPSGRFKMGSNAGSSNEQPVHEVYLDEFYIDQYEVTNEQFAEFLNDRGNQEEGGAPWLAEADWVRIHQNEGQWQADEGYANHRMVGITWYGARAYCDWRGGQLPTEAQWEKAARGTDERTYPWGENIDSHLARYYNPSASSEESGTAPVGHYPEGVSPYGAYDMAGNVWEWVADAYEGEYYKNSPSENPPGPDDAQNIRSKVLRGGGWYSISHFARASARGNYEPYYQNDYYGLRCAAAAAGP